MKTATIGSLAVLVPLIMAASAAVGTGRHDPSSGQEEHSLLHWMENRGQWSQELRLVAWTERGAVGVRRDALVVGLVDGTNGRSAELALVFEGAAREARVEGIGEEPGRHHYFVGNDPSHWIRGVRTFERAFLRGVYEGIDVVVRDEGGRLEYDLLVAPGADLSRVVVRCDGARGLLVEAGSVVVDTEAGTLVQPPPRSWEEGADGRPRPIEVAYRSIDERRFGFVAADRNLSLALVVDPQFHWSTYWGGIGNNGSPDMVADVVVDDNGFVTVTGTVEGNSFFPSESSFQSPVFGSIDVFVARFDRSDGSLVYASRIGGSDADNGRGVGVDSFGATIAVGTAGPRSDDFPITPGALDSTKAVIRESAYVLRLSSRGDDLEYSTFLNGLSASEACGVAVSERGSAVVIGTAWAAGFPTTPGAFARSSVLGTTSGYVSRLDPTGSFLEWSTIFPANEENGVALDAQENVVLTGISGGTILPITPGAFQPLAAGLGDAFVTRLSADGSTILASTFLGGKKRDEGWRVAVTRDGGVAVVGQTVSSDFPTTPGSFQEVSPTPPPTSFEDGFVTVLDPTFSKARFSTYLGGDGGRDFPRGVTVDGSGIVTVACSSGSFFPITPGAFRVNAQQMEATITRFHPSGKSVFYSSFLGGAVADSARGLAQGPEGAVTLVGIAGFGFPTTEGATFPDYIGGASDGFVATLELHLQGSRPFGVSQPSCLGPVNLAASVRPRAGAPFGVWCTQAPPSARGFLLVRSAHPSGEPLAGALSWIRPVQSDADGFAETSLGSLPPTRGLTFLCRYVFFDSPTCTGPSASAWSNGLLVTVP